MKMTSRYALVAAAGLLFGAVSSANAADLGGGCCADLEERVAELEATTARKGNRVVSLQVYGLVSRGILAFDAETDVSLFGGAPVNVVSESDTNLIDEDGSIFGFRGEAALKPGWKAGFRMEFDVSGEQAEAPEIKQNNVWIESEQLGRVTLGQQSVATDGIAHIVLANTWSDSGAFQGTLYSDLNSASASIPPFFAFNGLDITVTGASYGDFDGGRGDAIRYDSPSIYGFILSASWSDDLATAPLISASEDYWDVTLRYSGEFNAFRVAAGIGYTDDNSGNEILQGSASFMHIPTGLFAAVSAGEIDNTSEDYWYVTAGIEKTWLSYGATTFYGEYGQYNGAGFSATFTDNDPFSGTPDTLVVDFDGDETIWGLGITQRFDAAALDIYLQYRHVEGEFNGALVDIDSEFDTFLLGTSIAF